MCHLKASEPVTKMVSTILALSTAPSTDCLKSIEYQIVRSWNLNEGIIRFAYDTDGGYRGGVRVSRTQFQKIEAESPSDVDGIEWAFSPI